MSEELMNLNLTRKYRPSRMSEYIGNERLKETVLGWLGKGRRPQTILLKGSTGGGKTTMSRLIAKEYLCENRLPNEGACNECPNCLAIDEYIATGNTDDLVNIKEVNASKDSGVAAINQVLEEAEYPSFDGSWKIYILDECHRISNAGQNSLLKLVEEPPENVLFMFCTTDPEKMLDTLLNRCNIKLDVKKPTEDQMAGLLRRVCDLEGVPSDRKGISLIVDRSELVIRQALMDLENVIVQQESVDYENVIKVFDQKPNSLYFDFFRCLLDKDVYKYVYILHKIKSKMALSEFIRNLTNFTKRGIYIYNGIDLEGITRNEVVNMKQLFERFSIVEQGRLLEFLRKSVDGDLETNLLLLGFQGLDSEPEINNSEPEMVMESPNDIKRESAVTSEGKKAIQVERQEKSDESIGEAVKDIDPNEALELFNF